jgi:pilus assembly protein CpaB
MKRTVLSLLVAAVLGLVGSAVVLLYVKGADSRAVAGKQAVKVLMASQKIPAGTTGAQLKSDGLVELVTMPASTVPQDALRSIEVDLESLALNAELKPRQLVLRGMFEPPSEATSGLNIPEGKVAVTIPVVNNAGTIFLQPGSKVAVYNTFTTVDGTNKTPAGAKIELDHLMNHNTRLVLPSIEVLALGASGQIIASNAQAPQTAADQAADAVTDDSAKIDSSGTSTLVTVAATQDEAERLIHVAQTGTIYIVLLDDSSNLQPGPGVDNSTLFK